MTRADRLRRQADRHDEHPNAVSIERRSTPPDLARVIREAATTRPEGER